jgi:hypothetical protein
MNPIKLLVILTGLSLSLTVYAKDSDCSANLARSARAERWIAQRQQIEYLEKNGAPLKDLIRPYRSLIQDLFNTDAAQRVRILLAAFPQTRVIGLLDVHAPAPRFTEDLIRAFSMSLNREGVLAKLHVLADLEAEKLSD